MAWRSSGPLTWRRELGDLQKTYLFTSKAFEHSEHEHWGLYSVCTVSFGPTEDVAAILRCAWKALRYEVPGLGVLVDGCDAVYSVVDSDGAIERWAQQTFIVDSQKTADNVIASRSRRELPTLFWLPATSEVLLLASHWRIDAVGCLLLLQRLFELAGGKADVELQLLGETDLAKMSPSMEDAAGSPDSPTPEIHEWAKNFLTGFRHKTMATINFEYNGSSSSLPNCPAYQLTSLSINSSKAFVDACKRREISVSAAAYASLASAAFALGKDTDTAEYSTIMAVNMRPHLNAPFNTAAHPCQPYVSGMTPTVRKGESFEASTRMLSKSFKSWHTQEFNQGLRQIYGTISTALLSGLQSAAPPPNPPSGVTLSSLGVIEHHMKGEQYGDIPIRVDQFRFGVCMLSRQMLLYLWTFRGQVHLSVNYNEAYYDHSTPRRILEHILATLSNELDFNLQ